MDICREQLGNGITFTSIVNKTQKTNGIFINLITAIDAKNTASNAIVPYILSNSCEKYPTLTKLNYRLLELYGASTRGAVVKMGDNQVISLLGMCINDKYTFDGEKITAELTELLLNCLLHPVVENGGFALKEFEREKQEAIDDIRSEINDKRSLAFKNASKSIYKDEPFAVPIKGEVEAVEKLDAVQVYGQYRKLLETAAIEIIFAGAEQPTGIKEMFKNALSEINRTLVKTNDIAFSPLKSQPVYITDEHDVVQSKMVMAFKSDCTNGAAIRLMNAVFGGTPFSKLFMNVREKLSLCYYCSSSYNDKKGVLIVDSGVERVNIQKAQDEILRQLEAVKAGEFTADEVHEARLSMINALKGIEDSQAASSNWYLTRGFYNKMSSPEDEIKLLEAVSREDIIAAAQSFALDTVYVLTGKDGASDEE